MRTSQIYLVVLLVSLASWRFISAAEPTYWQDVRPVLRRHCTACHSRRTVDEVEVSGGLALDSYEAVIKAKKAVVHAGQSGSSLLIQLLIEKDEDKRMPRSSEPLTAEKIALLRRWIDAGAKEGKKPEEIVVAKRPPSRKRDITLTTSAAPLAAAVKAAASAKLELALPVGPLAPVTAVAFSPDGKRLAAGCYGRAAVWDLATARPVKVLTNVLGAVNDVRFSPDGKLLAVAGGQPSAKGDLRLYQTADWKLLAVLGGHEDVVFGIAFRPDGKQLASASFDKTVRVWDVTKLAAAPSPLPLSAQGRGASLERILTGHSDFVYAVAYSPDGRWLASAGKDRTVKVFDAATGKGRFTFSGMDQDVLAVAVSPDGKHVVSSGFESRLYWWDAQSGRRERVQGGHAVAVHELCFSKDGKLVASAGADKTLRLWDGTSGAAKRIIPVGSVVYAAALSPNAKTAATGSFDGLVRLWDMASGRLLVSLLALPPEGDRVDWLALTPDGYAASSSFLTKQVRWRMAGREVPANLATRLVVQPEKVAKAVRAE